MIHIKSSSVNKYFLLVIALVSCIQASVSQTNDTRRKFPTNELLVLYSPNIEEGLKDLIRDSIRKTGKVREFKVMKCACDADLEIWVGNDILTLLSDSALIKGEARPVSRSGVSEDTLFLSPNFESRIPGLQRTKMRPMPDVESRNENEVRVAVLDTGLDPKCFSESAKDNFLLKPSEIPFACTNGMNSRYAGWNFISSSDSFNDDHNGCHGTNVSGLILAEGTRNRLRILPLKTHNRAGVASMFNLLCAMKFAVKAKMDYINASWGDYGAENVVFSRMLREVEGSKIGFIAAAGNEGNDIHNVSFYPARYSDVLPASFTNIITVTTVNPQGRCTHNYSKIHVDIGAMGKKDACLFVSPFQAAGSTTLKVSGSSFATAVMAGKIANFHPYRGDGNFKTNILNSSALVPVAQSVSDIRTGKGYRQQ